jgi:alanine racemase
MATGRLHIDLDAIADNWRALSALSQAEAAAVVKADGYGLGAAPVSRALARAGCRRFFVAFAEEGLAVRKALGPGPEIMVLNGHMAADARALAETSLTPVLNSVEQLSRHLESLPGHPFAVQLDTGMNRLGLEWSEWAAVAEIALAQAPVLLLSHLACADEPDHPMNAYQIDLFRQMTDGLGVPRSLAATGGILLGPDYHFDLVRPGIGLYGGLPFEHAAPVVRLDLPVVQVRDLQPGEVAGYGNTWQAQRPSRLATVAAGYADGLFRSLSPGLRLWDGDRPCPAVGRVSMDLIIADVTDLDRDPETLTVLGERQGIDALAEAAGTIGYEVLTALGPRYARELSE